jgi:hypothetical protein
MPTVDKRDPVDGIEAKLIRAGQGAYGICLAINGILQLYYGDFRPQILPPWRIPGLAICARLMGLALAVSGLAIILNKKARMVALVWGGVLLGFIPIFHVPYMLLVSAHPNRLGSWADTFNTLALTGMAFVVAGSFGAPNRRGERTSALLRQLERLIPFGRFFCITIVAFGVCHFLYAPYIDTLVPAWVPWHRFWTYFAGTCLIGSGTAIIVKIRLRLFATLLGTMIFLWVIMLHIPRAIVDPYSGQGIEIESAARALAESGAAFLLAYTAPVSRLLRRGACVPMIAVAIFVLASQMFRASSEPNVTLFIPGVIPSSAPSSASPAFAPDGNTVYLGESSGGQNNTITFSQRTGGQWSAPKVAAFCGEYRDLEPAFAPNGKYLIFASSRPTTPGGAALEGHYNGQILPGSGGNLWKVELTKKGWQKPELLSATLTPTPQSSVQL